MTGTGPQIRSQPSAYSTKQTSQWLQRLNLPSSFHQYIADPQAVPKTFDSLRLLMRCQISTFTYENFSVHYSPTHLVKIQPEALFTKLMGPDNRCRGGYCMELSIFFHHMLLGLGFNLYMTGVRNRTRINGIPGGEYQGWTHINNIVHLPSGEKYAIDVAFGGDGPTTPLLLDGLATIHTNLGPQQVRIVHDFIPKQRLDSSKLWIYQYRNGPHMEWNPFYSFAEIEFFQEDFEVMNWWASAKTVHRWNVMAVRFLRQGESIFFSKSNGGCDEGSEISIIGKVMLVNDVIKVNLGGKTEIIRRFETEHDRLEAIKDYFGIEFSEEEREGIKGWDQTLK